MPVSRKLMKVHAKEISNGGTTIRRLILARGSGTAVAKETRTISSPKLPVRLSVCRLYESKVNLHYLIFFY